METIKEYQDILFDFYNGIAENHHQPSALPQRVHPHHHFGNQRRLYYCRECRISM